MPTAAADQRGDVWILCAGVDGGSGAAAREGVGGVPDVNLDDLVFAVGAVRTGPATGLVPIEFAADQSCGALVPGLAAAEEEVVERRLGCFRFYFALSDRF